MYDKSALVHNSFYLRKKLIYVLWENEGIQLRRNEKKTLNDINADKEGRLRFHINDNKGKRKKRIQTREEKLFVLANDWLTGDPSVHDLSLTQVHQSYIHGSVYHLITLTS